MKAERKEEEKWVPIVITLESKEEAQYLWGCLNTSTTKFVDQVKPIMKDAREAERLSASMQTKFYTEIDKFRDELK